MTKETRRDEDEHEFSEEQASLFRITFGPLIWAAHFVLCYGLVAVTCAKGWDIAAVRGGLIAFSALMLAGIGWVGRSAWRQWDVTGTGHVVNRGARAEDRHHFLGHAAFLLAIISGIGVVFVSFPLIFVAGCR